MTLEKQPDSSILAFGEPIWRNIIEATNACDYDAFCRDLGDGLKQSVSEERFTTQHKAVSQIDGDIGLQYDFLGCIRPGKGVCLVYRVRFDKSGSEALGRMQLDEIDGKIKVVDVNIN